MKKIARVINRDPHSPTPFNTDIGGFQVFRFNFLFLKFSASSKVVVKCRFNDKRCELNQAGLERTAERSETLKSIAEELQRTGGEKQSAE